MAVILAAIADEEGFNSDALYEVLVLSGKESLWEEAQAISAEDDDGDDVEDDPEVEDILKEMEDESPAAESI